MRSPCQRARSGQAAVRLSSAQPIPTMKTNVAQVMPFEPNEAEIQKLAHRLWIEGGCLEGVELENWLAAKELLRHRHGTVHGHAMRGARVQPGRPDR